MTDESGKKKRTKLWAVIGVIVAIVIGVTAAIAVGYGGAYLYFNAQAAKAYGVPLVVNAKGLDTDGAQKSLSTLLEKIPRTMVWTACST